MNVFHTKRALKRIQKAQENGIRIPFRAYRASLVAGVPFWATCAFLMQETGGGQNIFGHDPTIWAGAGVVTRNKYLAYKAERQKTGKMQGVGPMQLTWYSYQDDADALGGCWRPYVNVLVGMQILKRYRNAGLTWHEAARRYNGSGPAAEAYADKMDERFRFWQKTLGYSNG